MKFSKFLNLTILFFTVSKLFAGINLLDKKIFKNLSQYPKCYSLDILNKSSYKNLFKKDYKIIGFYSSWSIYKKPQIKPENLNPKLLTHLYYTFVATDNKANIILIDPNADIGYYKEKTKAEKSYKGNFLQLYRLKQKYPHLKIICCVGGANHSRYFSNIAKDQILRETFAKNILDFCKKYGFDGVDLDWEYPGYEKYHGTKEDRKNYVLLLQRLNGTLKAHNLILTISAPPSEYFLKAFDLPEIQKYVDWINIMTYNFTGPWSDRTFHHTALYASGKDKAQNSIDKTIKYFKNKGVSLNKIVLGISLFAKVFKVKEKTNDGLRCTHKQSNQFIPFCKIKNLKNLDYKKYWDNESKVPYLYNNKTREFVTYDDKKSLKIKSLYAKQQDLAGVIIWELANDNIPKWPALETIYQTLNS